MKRDAEEICQRNNITDDDLRSICKRYLVKQGRDSEKFWINFIEFEDFSDKNFGFLGLHLKLTLTLSPKKDLFGEVPQPNDEEEKLIFFVKIFPMSNEGQAHYVREFNIFEKETELYEFLIPRLQDITIGGGSPWAAQSYLCKDEKVLILEDLRLNGFQMALNSKLGLFDIDHLMVATRVIAKFHASSIILENRNHETMLQMYPKSVEENAYPDNEQSIRMKGLKNAIAAYQNLIPLIPKYQSDFLALEVINKQLPIVMKRIVDFAKTSTKFRNVFSHGDLWANNLLFRYENYDKRPDSDSSNVQSNEPAYQEVGEVDILSPKGKIVAGQNSLKPIDVRLVDFQLARYAPPAYDLMILLFMTTSKSFRQCHLKDICDNYYESLREELDRLGLDVNYELPKDQFLDSIEHYKLAGMIECLLFSHLTLLPESQTDKMFANSDEFAQFILDGEKRSAVCVDCFKKDEEYRSRLTEIIIELVDTHILETTAL